MLLPHPMALFGSDVVVQAPGSGNRLAYASSLAHVADAGHQAGVGKHSWRQKTMVLLGGGMGSRLSGNDAAVLLPTLHEQQSRGIAWVFAPFTAFASTRPAQRSDFPRGE